MFGTQIHAQIGSVRGDHTPVSVVHTSVNVATMAREISGELVFGLHVLILVRNVVSRAVFVPAIFGLFQSTPRMG
jgi:hypothetical protein